MSVPCLSINVIESETHYKSSKQCVPSQGKLVNYLTFCYLFYFTLTFD